MPTIPYGKEAYAIKSHDHMFRQDEPVRFIEIDSEIDVNSNEVYYVFESIDRKFVQTLAVNEFVWLD